MEFIEYCHSSHHQGTQANAIGLINNLLLKDKSIVTLL